jgi:hypothetical protein
MRLKASPAAFVGLVYAADRDSAIKDRDQAFEIRPAGQRRLLAIAMVDANPRSAFPCLSS